MSNKYYKYDGSIIPMGVAKVEPIIQQFLSIQDAMGKIQNDIDSIGLPPEDIPGTPEWFLDPANIGEPYAGGYLAGVIDTIQGTINGADTYQSGERYALIVSDKDLESEAGVLWDTRGVSAPSEPGCKTRWNGLAATNAILAKNDDGTYPIFGHIRSIRTSNPAPAVTGGSDWYIPAMDELEPQYRNFKPTEMGNSMFFSTLSFPGEQQAGQNPSSDPVGGVYSNALEPFQTSIVAFKEGGDQALDLPRYWSATDADEGGLAWTQTFTGFGDLGGQTANSKDVVFTGVRPVRRVVF